MVKPNRNKVLHIVFFVKQIVISDETFGFIIFICEKLSLQSSKFIVHYKTAQNATAAFHYFVQKWKKK